MSCGVAYTLQIIGQKHLDPTVASLILSLESVVSVLAGWVILGETLNLKEIFGCVLVFCGGNPGAAAGEGRGGGAYVRG